MANLPKRLGPIVGTFMCVWSVGNGEVEQRVAPGPEA
jgi:hypothetical protein